MKKNPSKSQKKKPVKKDRWDKAEILLSPLGGIFAAVSVALVGFIGSHFLEKRQINDMRLRLYTELISKREEAESNLRKDMFKEIISSFLDTQKSTMGEKVLELELLANNFHESLNLTPLFHHLDKEIKKDSTLNEEQKEEYWDSLYKVARELSFKQLGILESAGQAFHRTVYLDTLKKHPGGYELEPSSLELDGIQRDFKLKILAVNPRTREISVRLEIFRHNPEKWESDENQNTFWLSFFDFPMIDHTRMSNNQRCAVVMTDFDDRAIEIAVVYFPGTYASIKEKPYYQEIIQNLLKEVPKKK
jgi:hypothetical protein